MRNLCDNYKACNSIIISSAICLFSMELLMSDNKLFIIRNIYMTVDTFIIKTKQFFFIVYNVIDLYGMCHTTSTYKNITLR